MAAHTSNYFEFLGGHFYVTFGYPKNKKPRELRGPGAATRERGSGGKRHLPLELPGN